MRKILRVFYPGAAVLLAAGAVLIWFGIDLPRPGYVGALGVLIVLVGLVVAATRLLKSEFAASKQALATEGKPNNVLAGLHRDTVARFVRQLGDIETISREFFTVASPGRGVTRSTMMVTSADPVSTIDRYLGEFRGRSLISTAELQNMLLDLRLEVIDTEALRLIDAQLCKSSGRELADTDSVADALLDIRRQLSR